MGFLFAVSFFLFLKSLYLFVVQIDVVFKLFVILQKYDFSSKSQLLMSVKKLDIRCLWYCKSTIFQANHNNQQTKDIIAMVVCDTAKVRFFKQITTEDAARKTIKQLFVILQKYDFSSKSQQQFENEQKEIGCLWYCKSTIFQANHNRNLPLDYLTNVVCDTAKVRFFKQITTHSV